MRSCDNRTYYCHEVKQYRIKNAVKRGRVSCEMRPLSDLLLAYLVSREWVRSLTSYWLQ